MVQVAARERIPRDDMHVDALPPVGEDALVGVGVETHQSRRALRPFLTDPCLGVSVVATTRFDPLPVDRVPSEIAKASFDDEREGVRHVDPGSLRNRADHTVDAVERNVLRDRGLDPAQHFGDDEQRGLLLRGVRFDRPRGPVRSRPGEIDLPVDGGDLSPEIR